MEQRILSKGKTKQVFANYKEFTSNDKDRYASVIESGAKESILSPILDSYIFASSIALQYGDRYGTVDPQAHFEHAINKNCDYFDTTIIHEVIPDRNIQRYETFRTARMFTNHNSKDVENAIGFVLDVYDCNSDYEDMHLNLLFGIDKTKAPRIARDLETMHQKVSTSMGCSISGSRCTVCDQPNCQHIKYMRGGRVNGVKVAELLEGIEFFEDSIVTTPACHTAYVLDALTEIVPGRMLKIASTDDNMMVTAGIMKSVYDSIKTASTREEKIRLSDNLDRLILKLESLASTK